MRSRWQRSVTAVVAALAVTLAPLCAAQDDDESPGAAPPPTGWAAMTVLALLSYNREQCDGIAGKLVARWRGLSASPATQLETVRQWVVDRELSTLASARSASDLIVSFLPRVREEARRDVGDSLERLHASMTDLCDTVAFPNGSRETFESQMAAILDRIEREEAELGRMMPVAESDLKNALASYLGHIQLAGVEAEGEYRDYLDSLKPPPEQPTFQERMEAWHRGYARAVLPTKQALGKYLRGRQTNDSSLIRTSCREILGAVIPLQRDDLALEAPLPAVVVPLRNAFRELQSMASECTAGRSREMEVHYREMQIQLAAAAEHLAEFSLKP